MSQTNDHTFWVAPHPASMSVFHVDKECRRLKGEPRAKDHNYVEWHDLEICSWCDPNKESPYE